MNSICCDCLEWTKGQADDSVDLILGSPPYENRRSYGIDFSLKGQEWVDWALERFLDQYRICSGLVCWIVDGHTKNFRWSAVPALLMADLHRAGVHLRKPPIFQRWGIPGSGGNDWWRNNYEFCICASKGKLPWSDNKATGLPCKYKRGGHFTYRLQNGKRCKGKKTGRPEITNPGNVIKCIVGGGRMGSGDAHKNEAPFPESLVRPFIVSFCKPGGLVYDPFCGSGTTGAVALREGRRFIGTDIRESEIETTQERLHAAQFYEQYSLVSPR